MDFNGVVGVLGVLAGTFLGAWMTGRAQRKSLNASFHREWIRQRETAYVDFLTAMRQFRRFLLTSGEEVRLLHWIPGTAPGIPSIEGDDKHWEALEMAHARLRILIDSQAVQDAADNSVRSLYALARAMAKQGSDIIPEDELEALRIADRKFENAAKYDLHESRVPS